MDIAIWWPVWQALNERIAEEGMDTLSQEEQMWLLLRNHLDDVQENGIIGFYLGEYACKIEAMIAAWQQLGVWEMANIFERADLLLPSGGHPADDAEREQYIAIWESDDYHKLFQELETDFEECLPAAEQALGDLLRRILGDEIDNL